MDRDILLLIVGALIGFVGSMLSTFVSYVLENKRTKRQWQREDYLREESRKQEEIKLAQDFTMQANLKKLSDAKIFATAIAKDGFFCFLPETSIALASHKAIPIESLKVGDAILSYDLDKKELIEGNISEIKESEVESYVIINGSIKVTTSHLFRTRNGWQRSGEINLQHELYAADGNYIPVTKLEKINKHAHVYNLELINNLPFFAENVLVGTFSEKQSYDKNTSSDNEVIEFDPNSGEVRIVKKILSP